MIALVIEGKSRPIGALDVTRLLPMRERRAVGPFVFLDHMGPVTSAPGQGFDVLPHPHIGLSTVTYLFEGESVHRDSMGIVQTIRPGEVNLMTAGKGVVHSERSAPEWRARGGTMHGLQLWLGLPSDREDDEPSFSHHPRASLPEVTARGVRGRLIMGEMLGVSSPVPHPSRPLLMDLEMEADSAFTFDEVASDVERALYVVEGEVEEDEHTCGPRHLLVAEPGSTLAVYARKPSRVVMLGGPPLQGKRFMDWNFVSSSRERIDRARAAWREREFPAIPGDDQEFVPLPG